MIKHWIDERTGKPKIVIQLCANKGSDTKYYAQNGYDVRLVGIEIGVQNYHAPQGPVWGVFANPVCTQFSIARTHAKTPRDLNEGIFLLKECQRVIWECQCWLPSRDSIAGNLKWWVIENPATGAMKNFLGRPDFIYCHSDYGEEWTKKTALWGVFNEPFRPLLKAQLPVGRSLVKDKNSFINKNRNSDEATNERSQCPDLFAKYFYMSNT
jgi:hypothetical protein